MNFKLLLFCLVALPSYCYRSGSYKIADFNEVDKVYWAARSVRRNPDILETYHTNKPYLNYGADEWEDREEKDHWGADQTDYEFDMFSVDAFGKG